jgi:hypothetical protein
VHRDTDKHKAEAQEQSNLVFCVAALLTIVAASLFALQTDDRENSFQVSRGEAFYIQVSIDCDREWSWKSATLEIENRM